MAYVEPLYSQEDVDLAGRIIADTAADVEAIDWALHVFTNWRSSHNYPLNGMAMVLKQRARRIAGQPKLPVFQRLKRIESVERKLRARDDITLSTMQDIGGCRAVLDDVRQVLDLRDVYLSKRLTHSLKQQNDYIARPKKDGYRSIHLVYYFVGKDARAQIYAERSMQVEIQMRTTLQHYWATAVETAETFTKQPLKSQRDENTTPWRQFFALVSSCFAHEEGCALVPRMSKNIHDIYDHLRDLEQQHRFCDTLEAYKATAEAFTARTKDRYYLVELDLETLQTSLKGFRPDEAAEAAEQYIQTEQGSLIDKKVQAVLVSIDDVSQLKRAYPNYFLDTTEFVRRVREITD